MRVVTDFDGTVIVGSCLFEHYPLYKVLLLFIKTRLAKRLYFLRPRILETLKLLKQYEKRGGEIIVLSASPLSEEIKNWCKNHFQYFEVVANENEDPILFKIEQLKKLNPDLLFDNCKRLIETWNSIQPGRVLRFGRVYIWSRL
jgi:TusA-related sulfurtransferase